MNCSWILEKVRGKQIKNISLQDTNNYFPEGPIDISQYLLVNISYQTHSKQKCLSFLQLLLCEPRQKFLQGPHQVRLYLPDGNESVFWTYSLTCLKKQFFYACDRLAFERCTFLVLPDTQTLVRIKCLRSRLVLHKQPRPSDELLYFAPTQAVLTTQDCLRGEGNTRKGSRKNEITLRTKHQMQHFLDQLLTSYIRDLNWQTLREDVVTLFKQDLVTMLDVLK